MTASTSDRPLTADEFLDLPRPELTRRELIDGELVVVHGPGLDHQLAVGALYYRLQQWCHGGTGRGFLVLDGDTGLNDRTVLRPDLQWFAAGRDNRAEERRSLPLGDQVVEVRSPTTRSRDIG
ncbi:MAG: Uma2 family endonuclease, partial [Solirubrobacteraceae bacterium]